MRIPYKLNSIKLFFTNFKILGLTLLISTALNAQEADSKKIVHSVYVTANTGIRSDSNNERLLRSIVRESKKEDSSSLVIVGNIVPEKGFPDKDEGRQEIEEYLKKNLLDHLSDFKGKVVFTPGVNEWQKDAPDNIDDLESFLQDNSTADFWPDDGCPIEGESLSEKVELVTVDTQWYLENWDDHPYINNKCDYKTRQQFIVEFQDELKDNQGKTILVALHHPVLSNTRVGFIEKIVGAGNQNWRNPQYKDLRGKLESLARQFKDVIFLSGNDHNLQFIEDDGIEQVISGITEKVEKTRLQDDEDNFSSHELGYAKLNIYSDGSSNVEFYKVTPEGSEKIHSNQIKREMTRLEEVSWPPRDKFGQSIETSIYTVEETDKSGFYEFIWGEHYRPVYSRKFEFPIVFLDTMPGNLRPIAEGGGHQSRSLRFIDENKHEYTLRALKKSALRFLQTTVIPQYYVEDFLENTVAERYVQDFYTTAHPYAPFAVNGLMDALDINHATQKVYYVPKQKALGIYNKNYGNELYMWEEHVGDENKEFEIFGSPDDILSTKDLMLDMRETKDVYVDEKLYLRARLLDMLIGDWDRHADQWRWAEYEEGDKKRYEPIPRDRDQAFPKYDGPVLKLLKAGFPIFRNMETYDEMVDNPKWFNIQSYALDKTLIKTASWEDWKEQVNFIQNKITDKVIEKSFKEKLPGNTYKDESIEVIKAKLKARRANLEKIAKDFYKYIKEFDMITGTDEDDEFLITRKPDGKTTIQIRNKDDKLVFENTYDYDLTEELWIYGLDGDDTFIIEGEGNKLIKLKVLGGEENDIYDFRNTRKAKLYDYKSKDNTIKTPRANKWLVDSYDINNYNPGKKRIKEFTFFPGFDFNSDTGFQLGGKATYTTNGLATNPFTTQQSLSINYFFSTEGYDIEYIGEFAHIFYNWNLGINLYHSSPNFTMNYFGTGNETTYDPDAVDRDFNRVKIRQWRFAPSLIWRDVPKSRFYIKPMIQSYEVSDDDERFIGQAFDPSNDVYDSQIYGGLEINYNYYNKDYAAFPSRGMELDFTAGYKTNIDGGENSFGYIRPILSVNYPLHESGVAAFATKIGGEAILGDDYEFYHGAVLGGGNESSLRGYRNQRFNGKYSFFQNTDIRVGLTKFRTNFAPLKLGVSVGFDYGRVWVEDDNSERWHSNYGGSLFVNAFNAFTGNLGYYIGEDGGRFNFTINFGF